MTEPPQATKPYKLDAYGFPAIDCNRCAGKGEIPQYHKVFEGVCFECDGAGCVYPTKTIANAAKGARRQLAATSNPTPELLAQVAASAIAAREGYDKTLARRVTRTGSSLDAATRRLVADTRAILNNAELDNIEQAVEIHRLLKRRLNSTAARRVRDDINSIQMGHDEEVRGSLPQRLDLIATYLDNLTGGAPR